MKLAQKYPKMTFLFTFLTKSQKTALFARAISTTYGVYSKPYSRCLLIFRISNIHEIWVSVHGFVFHAQKWPILPPFFAPKIPFLKHHKITLFSLILVNFTLFTYLPNLYENSLNIPKNSVFT